MLALQMPDTTELDRLIVAIDDAALIAGWAHRALDVGWETPSMVASLEHLLDAARRAYVRAIDVGADAALLARAESSLEDLLAVVCRAHSPVPRGLRFEQDTQSSSR